jgi:galactokinase
MIPASRTANVPPFADVASRARYISDQFKNLYGEASRLYRAPGRVNLIGEHTDYNDGFVMPAAIDFDCWIAISAREGNTVTVRSANLDETREFDLEHPQPHHDWSDYIKGVGIMLRESGYPVSGAKMLVSSNVPIGGGLSSSAALEVAAGYALLDTQGFAPNLLQLALACQRAENEFVGARCGIMDQFVACHGQEGQAMLLDCRSLEHRLLPIPKDTRLVICNTMVKHEISASEYNVRRSQCEEGARLLATALPGVTALRDITAKDFEQHGERLPLTLQKRCRHVITENERVLSAASALEQSDLRSFGSLMLESHKSLRDDYEVSCSELDLMVDLALETEGVYGARMTGGGFGGCTVNLVASKAVAEFQRKLAVAYHAQVGVVPEIYVSTPSQGVGRVPEPQ